MSDSMQGQMGFKDRVMGAIERLLALRIVDAERLQLAADPHNIYIDPVSNRRPMMVAAILALLFHIFILVMYWPSLGRQELIFTKNVLQLKNLARPAGGGPPKPEVKEEVKKVPPKPKTPKLMPIPDPTPLEPEPIIQQQTLDVAPVQDELAVDLNIGEIAGPPGRGSGSTGTGNGPASGPGDATGGDGIYTVGTGVHDPVLVRQTLPSYTDEAIKAKVQGMILLEVVIRKDGSLDSFRILKPLGYGLDEKAIEEIANNWEFRPATLNGQPVDFRAVIEVTFTLR